MCDWRQAMAPPFKERLDSFKSGLGEAHMSFFLFLSEGLIVPRGWGSASCCLKVTKIEVTSQL